MLSCAYILPDPCTLRLPDRFRAWSIYIFSRHGHSYCIFCCAEIDFRAKGLCFSTEHWSPAKPYLDWEIGGWRDCVHWDHSREGEILALGWTCSRNALQKMSMEPLWGGARQQIMCEYLLAFGNSCMLSKRQCKLSMTNPSVEHKGPAVQLLLTLLFITPQLRQVWFLLISSAVLLSCLPSQSNTRPITDNLTICPAWFSSSISFHTRIQKLSQRFLLSVRHSLSQVIHHPQWRLNMNTHMNIWITEQVGIVIHLQALCRACKVFCLEPVVLLSRGFLTERLKWGRGEWEHRCYWVVLLLRKNDLCLKMPPLPVFRTSCYAPVSSLFSGYHAGIKTCHLPRW